MKVLFNTYPMAFHTPGGGEVQLMEYKKNLEAESVFVELLDAWKPSFRSYDLIHFFSCMSGSVHFCQFVKSIGLPLVVSPNLWITEKSKGEYPFEEIRNQFVLANRVVCNSAMESFLLSTVFNIPNEKFEVVYNGVGDGFCELICPSGFRAEFGIDGPFVLNVANLEPRKNQIRLIRAMKSFPDLKLVIIGYPRDPEYARLCMEEGGDQVRYLGSLPHDSPLLKSAYAACELFALPSLLETPGLAALEASASGAKIVITREGCAQEYFGAGAEYVRPDDVDDIVRAISKTLQQQRSFLPTIVVRANFTWQQAVRKLASVYCRAVDTRTEESTASGFYAVEHDGNRLFAWSMSEFSFSSSPGVMSFLWRSLDEAHVDIYIDDVVVLQRIKVGEEWSRYSLNIPRNTGDKARKLLFKVHVSTGLAVNDDRVLGVAMAEVFLSSLV